MCLWYAGSTTDILKEMYKGQEQVVNQKLWKFAGKVKVLSLRKAIYKPYESTENELRAAVDEIENGKKESDKNKKLEPFLDAASTSEVVSNLKLLSKENLMARAATLKENMMIRLGDPDGEGTA